ncbi:MAG: zinc-binding dehydrogenase, partial [Anaerolineae bacterium]
VVFETAGTVPTTQQTMKVVKRGGVVVIVGLPAEDVFPMSMMEVVAKELDVRGIFRYANIYPTAIELVSSGQVDVKSLITHTFTLEQTQEALEFAHERKDISIKSVIKVG